MDSTGANIFDIDLGTGLANGIYSQFCYSPQFTPQCKVMWGSNSVLAPTTVVIENPIALNTLTTYEIRLVNIKIPTTDRPI